MRKLTWVIAVLLSATLGCSKTDLQTPTSPCTVTDNVTQNHPKASRIQQVLDEIVKEGVPGVSVAIRTEEGTWAGAAGLAKIETKEQMQICHLQYGQSVAKTYMAVAILLLKEAGRINLDESITAYLPANVSSKITDAGKITVRMLLNHTSGIPEYNDKPKYVTYLLQHPLHEFTSLDYLNYIEGMPLVFAPGSKYRYTNTNYLLLALIADTITGDHARYIRNNILEKQGLNNSYYHEPGFLNKPALVNSYWDRYSNRQIENCSQMQKVNVRSLVGDDGIIATPTDFVRFMQALFQLQILSQESLNEMLTFVPKEPGEQEGYGLGIHREYYNGYLDYGHTGGGIGSGCVLSYFPDKNAYVFLGINIGTSIYSPNFDNLEDKINKITDILLE